MLRENYFHVRAGLLPDTIARLFDSWAGFLPNLELVVLSNLESFNSELIKLSIPKQKRFKQLQEMAQKQIQQLNTWETEKKFKQIDNNTNLIE